jgi:hypothetical protein
MVRRRAGPFGYWTIVTALNDKRLRGSKAGYDRPRRLAGAAAVS